MYIIIKNRPSLISPVRAGLIKKAIHRVFPPLIFSMRTGATAGLVLLALGGASIQAQADAKTDAQMGSPDTEEATETGRTYVKVEVDGLACPFCAYGLEKKLKKIEGQKNLFIEIQEGYASFHVPGKSGVTEARLQKIVKDAGFTVRKLAFSPEPFERSKRDEDQKARGKK